MVDFFIVPRREYGKNKEKHLEFETYGNNGKIA